MWIIFAFGSVLFAGITAILAAVFASFTSIFGKIGIQGVDSILGTAIRTIIVLVITWVVVFGTGKQIEVINIFKKGRCI